VRFLRSFLVGLCLLFSASANAAAVWPVYEAPHPWGPWTLIQTNTWNPLGLYFPAIIPKSLSLDNGNTCMIATAGNYNLQSISTGLYTLILVNTTINN